MPATFRAILSLTEPRFLEHGQVLGAGRDPHGLGLPKTEGIDGSTGPRAAGAAMTVTHRFRRSGDFDCYSAAKAFTHQTHLNSSLKLLTRPPAGNARRSFP